MRDMCACFTAMSQLDAKSTVEEECRMFLEVLLAAAVLGNYDSVAANLAKGFWGGVGVVGFEVVPVFRDLVAVLIKKCPGLKEPLRKALNEQNPFKDLLAPDEPPAPSTEETPSGGT